MNCELIFAVDMPERLKPMFAAYQEWLLQNDPQLQKCLNVQGYDEELTHLHKKYGAPEGTIYILQVDGEDAGCVALRKLDEECCELKRFFLYTRYRGFGLGRMMLERMIADAAAYGYRTMYLDTLPFMDSAGALYQRMGFIRTERYNDNPMPYAIYMKRDLP